jgi:hypothetical protein
MKLAPVIDRITAAGLGFRTVRGIEALAGLDTATGALPAAFVIPDGFTVLGGSEGSGLIDLETEDRFNIVIIVAGAADPDKVRDELESLAAAITALLLGWTPDSLVYRPIRPTTGRLLGLSPGRASFIVNFRTAYHLRKVG